MQVVTRFAPSPTGYLHLGHAYAARIAWRRARRAGGRFLLRLEDIDRDRCRPAFAASILEDLAWLGLDWDGPVRVQSAHLAVYVGAIETLRRRGLVYPCFCSRADIRREIAAAAAAPHGPDDTPRYPGTCRGLAGADRDRRIAAGHPHAWRLDMAAALGSAPPLTFVEEAVGTVRCEPDGFGDVVLGRRDASGSYHLCATHDDALQGVSLVTRGADLLPATHLHRLLQHLMDWPSPVYVHHRLLLGPDRSRLSKGAGARALREMRAIGMGVEDVLGMINPDVEEIRRGG